MKSEDFPLNSDASRHFKAFLYSFFLIYFLLNISDKIFCQL